MSRCVIYAAKSTEDRKGSIPTQLADCHAMAEREGWDVLAEYNDDGFSAWKGNRGPGLEQAKAHAVADAAETGAEVMLLAQHSDRFARGAGDAPGAADHLGEMFFWAKRHRIRLRSVQDDHNLEDALRAVLMGERNTEDSHRKSEAVRSGKQRQFERGERLGGPVPDGYVLHVKRDSADRIVERRYDFDPTRRDVIARAFELAEAGMGDPSIARRLNAEGHRTKAGKGWTRRRVQDTLTSPFYAGRVVLHRGKPEQVERPGSWPALIDGERFDALRRARASRDHARKGRPVGGRPTVRFALSKLARCVRCGEQMYVQASPYTRKDGGRARHYVCKHQYTATGLCDQPRIDAEVVDRHVIAHLETFFLDFDAWLETLKRGRARESDDLTASVSRERDALAKLNRREAKLRAYWLAAMDAGDDRRESIAFETLEALLTERDQVKHRIEATEGALRELEAEPPYDDMLDFWNGLSAAVRGRIDVASGMAEVNERLREIFEAVELEVTDEVVTIQPVLLEAVLEEWAAKKGSTRRRPIFGVATGNEQITPPVRPIDVSSETGGNSRHSGE